MSIKTVTLTRSPATIAFEGEEAPKTVPVEEFEALKKQAQEAARKHASDLEALKTKHQLSNKEREELDKQVQSLKQEYMTKEELAKEAESKLRKQADDERTNLVKEVETWKGKYHDSTINRALLDAAVANDAYNPNQVIALLRTQTNLVDVEGKLEPRVSLTVKDKTLALSPTEAVAKMKEDDAFLNLFKVKGKGGHGGTGNADPTTIDVKNLTPERYRELRKSGKLTF